MFKGADFVFNFVVSRNEAVFRTTWRDDQHGTDYLFGYQPTCTYVLSRSLETPTPISNLKTLGPPTCVIVFSTRQTRSRVQECHWETGARKLWSFWAPHMPQKPADRMILVFFFPNVFFIWAPPHLVYFNFSQRWFSHICPHHVSPICFSFWVQPLPHLR